MGDFTKPKLNKSDPNKWFIYYNFIVPADMRHLHPRGWKRFKVYAGINRLPENEREKAAADLISELSLALRNGWYNPFEVTREVIKQVADGLADRPRTDMLCSEVFPLFIQSRIDRKLDYSSVTAYEGTVEWLAPGINDIMCGQVKYVNVSDRINIVAKDRGWSATTINKEFDFVQTIFNWMALEDYMVKNPIKGKVQKLPTDKTIHKWYDRDTAIKVRAAILTSKTPWLINVCQFTYEIMIRSKQELMNIRVGDIDFELQTINFRKEWTKNSADQNRDYPDTFHFLVMDMGLNTLPKDWYIFGKSGQPGPVMCGHNFFSKAWRTIRDDIGLSEDYTIYGWKHTAIVHAMMKGIDGYTISHRARHGDTKTTDDYKRDYDITLNKVYASTDLCFYPKSA